MVAVDYDEVLAKTFNFWRIYSSGEEVSEAEAGVELKASRPGTEVMNCIFSSYT